MQYKFALDWWECSGFDGEGCGVQIVYQEDIQSGMGGYIPGVEVISQ